MREKVQHTHIHTNAAHTHTYTHTQDSVKPGTAKTL